MKALHILGNIIFAITGALAALGCISIAIYELWGYPTLLNLLTLFKIQATPEQIWMISGLSAFIAMAIFFSKNKRKA